MEELQNDFKDENALGKMSYALKFWSGCSIATKSARATLRLRLNYILCLEDIFKADLCGLDIGKILVLLLNQ
jgi:hypothetical protein